MDFSAGVLALYNNYWLGASYNHLNQPDQSLLENSKSAPLPKKFSLQAGAKIPLDVRGSEQASNKDFFHFDRDLACNFDIIVNGSKMNNGIGEVEGTIYCKQVYLFFTLLEK